MSLGNSSNIVTNGLVFHYDMGNPKSWKGKPTTNYFYDQNARQDGSYSAYVSTSSGTWPARHPDAIRAYNYSGTEITEYVNGGVADYTNTYHAVWTHDPILNKPVVVQRDYDGNWKAKSWGTGQTMSSMGLGYGSTYSISWLQWVDDTAKSANAGLYGQNTGGSNGFHDGQSNSFGTSYNTKAYTWQRVHATYTVSSAWNLNAGLSCYMYGHYIKRGVIKIADVQLEVGTPSNIIENGGFTRSNTQALVDLTGNNTITANSLTYNSDGSFEFDGINNYATFGNNSAISSIGGTTNITVEAWVKYDTYDGNNGAQSYSVVTHKGTPWTWLMENPSNRGRIRFTIGGADVNCADPDTHPLNTWMQWVGTYDGANMKFYRNGVLKNTVAATGVLGSNSINATLGEYSGSYRMNGKISTVKVYNRALTSAEVQQNFNALRGRYGL